jgi:hypothetical protein
MLRNAVRQSARAVGAVSAAGRVAAVSAQNSILPEAEPTTLGTIENHFQAPCIHRNIAPGAQLTYSEFFFELLEAVSGSRRLRGPVTVSDFG